MIALDQGHCPELGWRDAEISVHDRLIHGAGLVSTEMIGRHRWHELSPDVLLTVGHWAGDKMRERSPCSGKHD